jgi:ComF family protein
MVNGWTTLAQRTQAMLLPPSCVLCGDHGQPPLLDICMHCVTDLPPNLAPCPLCAQPRQPGMEFTWPCGQCLSKPHPFDRALAPFIYDYPLDHLIHAFKYGGVLSYGRVLGMLLAYYLRTRGEPLPEALIPVPLHAARQRERGFNQAYELARPLSQLLGIPIDDMLCRRKRETQDQTELTAGERRRNVRNAFSLLRKPLYKHVALIDDVLTTGSTVGEVARMLKSGGVARVEVWTVARAVQRSS